MVNKIFVNKNNFLYVADKDKNVKKIRREESRKQNILIAKLQ